MYMVNIKQNDFILGNPDSVLDNPDSILGNPEVQISEPTRTHTQGLQSVHKRENPQKNP